MAAAASLSDIDAPRAPPLPAALSVALALLAGGCTLLGVEPVPCATDVDCPSSIAFCVDGACAPDGPPPPPDGPTPLALDRFEREVALALGEAPIGGVWECADPTASAIRVEDGRALITPLGDDERNCALLAGLVDVDVAVTAALTAPNADATIEVRSRRFVDGVENAYVVELGNGELDLDALLGDTPTAIAPGAALPPAAEWRARVRIVGSEPSLIAAKAWDAAGAEPLEWLVEATDASPALAIAGGIALGADDNDGVRFDDFVVYAAADVAADEPLPPLP